MVIQHSHGIDGPFIHDFPIQTSVYQGFSMAMLNNQRVYASFWFNRDSLSLGVPHITNLSWTFPNHRVLSFVRLCSPELSSPTSSDLRPFGFLKWWIPEKHGFQYSNGLIYIISDELGGTPMTKTESPMTPTWTRQAHTHHQARRPEEVQVESLATEVLV